MKAFRRNEIFFGVAIVVVVVFFIVRFCLSKFIVLQQKCTNELLSATGPNEQMRFGLIQY